MRPIPMLLASIALLGLGFGGGLLLARPDATESPTTQPATAEVPSKALHQGATANDSELAVLRERVRELEDELDEEAARTGDAEVIHVGKPVRRLSLGDGMHFEGSMGDHISPEMAEQIAAAMERAIGTAELDCEGDDCIMVGEDGMPMEGVQIQTMGDIDPEEVQMLVQQAMSGEAPEGAVGVMIIDAAIEVDGDE